MQFHSKQTLWNFKHMTSSIGAEGLETKALSAQLCSLGARHLRQTPAVQATGGRAREASRPVDSEGGRPVWRSYKMLSENESEA